VGDIDLKVILNKFQKARFWKKRSVENVVTHGPTTQPHLKTRIKEDKK
jgi:hypothetical protein